MEGIAWVQHGDMGVFRGGPGGGIEEVQYIRINSVCHVNLLNATIEAGYRAPFPE